MDELSTRHMIKALQDIAHSLKEIATHTAAISAKLDTTLAKLDDVRGHALQVIDLSR